MKQTGQTPSTAKASKGDATKARLVTSALGTFHTQGYRGTGVAQLLAESGFPRGSLYFHFPGGKEEIAAAAIDQARDEIGIGIDLAFAAAADPIVALRLVVDGFASELESSGFVRGCPVTTVALETDSDTPRLEASCAKAYADWQSRICNHLLAAGIPRERAPRLATFALSAIEGALILARAQRSRAPLDDAIAELALLFA